MIKLDYKSFERKVKLSLLYDEDIDNSLYKFLVDVKENIEYISCSDLTMWNPSYHYKGNLIIEYYPDIFKNNNYCYSLTETFYQLFSKYYENEYGFNPGDIDHKFLKKYLSEYLKIK